MAKPFYSIEEVCQRLGKTQDQIKAMVRDGALREFRDAGKIFFKAEDIDSVAGKGGGKGDTGEINLESVDDAGDELPTLRASSGGTSVIGLQPLPDEENAKKKEDTVITASGIGVFDDDELEVDADPMAKTQITTSQVDDQVSLESSGSGSGLLDLTREADDTSLGAELLDEIYPGEDEAAAKPAAKPSKAARVVEAQPAAAEEEAEPVEAGELLAPIIVQTGDPAEGMFGGMLVAALLVMALAGAVVAAGLQGFLPDFAAALSNQFWIFTAVCVALLGISIGAGWFVGRAAFGGGGRRK